MRRTYRDLQVFFGAAYTIHGRRTKFAEQGLAITFTFELQEEYFSLELSYLIIIARDKKAIFRENFFTLFPFDITIEECYLESNEGGRDYKLLKSHCDLVENKRLQDPILTLHFTSFDFCLI